MCFSCTRVEVYLMFLRFCYWLFCALKFLYGFETRSEAQLPTMEAENDDVELEKSNVILIGPTGSGNDSESSMIFLAYISLC